MWPFRNIRAWWRRHDYQEKLEDELVRLKRQLARAKEDYEGRFKAMARNAIRKADWPEEWKDRALSVIEELQL